MICSWTQDIPFWSPCVTADIKYNLPLYMKASIHPEYHDAIKVSCTGCGMSFTGGSTKQSISVHVCYKCHPFYTGEQRFIDTKGKVEKFQKKMEQSKIYAAKVAEKKDKAGKDQKETKSLRDLLAGM